MKKMNKKGFTIVELVIVIAVIAILAAVMIPTFSGIVTKAQKSANLQKARNAYAQYTADIAYDKGLKAADIVYVEFVGANNTKTYAVINAGVVAESTVTSTSAAPEGSTAIIIDINGDVVPNE